MGSNKIKNSKVKKKNNTKTKTRKMFSMPDKFKVTLMQDARKSKKQLLL